MPAEAVPRLKGAQAATLRGDLLELTRMRLNLMVVLTTAMGFVMAADGAFPVALFFHTLIATALVACGSSVLNQVLEREIDARMKRTANRPLPAGRIDPDVALFLGVLLSVVGLVYLVLAVNLLTALLGALTLASYLFVYTPLKPVSSLSTVIGAVPGAVPPVMGWAALRGDLGLEAWALFGILFFWQIPHFLAIAWLYRQDYERGGLPMLPVVDAGGAVTARQMVLHCAALVPISALPSVVGLNGPAYLAGALVLGMIYLWYCLGFVRARSNQAARRLMLASVIYLPALLTVMLLDRLLPR